MHRKIIIEAKEYENILILFVQDYDEIGQGRVAPLSIYSSRLGISVFNLMLQETIYIIDYFGDRLKVIENVIMLKL